MPNFGPEIDNAGGNATSFKYLSEWWQTAKFEEKNFSLFGGYTK